VRSSSCVGHGCVGPRVIRIFSVSNTPQKQSQLTAQSVVTHNFPFVGWGWGNLKIGEGQRKKNRTNRCTLHTNLEEKTAELGAEGIHLLGAELVLLLPHGLPLVLILHKPSPQLAHLDRPKRFAIKKTNLRGI
jgi:hypothetical protein